MAIKFTQDALVDSGMIADDNKKFIKAVRIEPASDLPKDSSVILIEGGNNSQIILTSGFFFFSLRYQKRERYENL